MRMSLRMSRWTWSLLFALAFLFAAAPARADHPFPGCALYEASVGDVCGDLAAALCVDPATSVCPVLVDVVGSEPVLLACQRFPIDATACGGAKTTVVRLTCESAAEACEIVDILVRRT